MNAVRRYWHSFAVWANGLLDRLAGYFQPPSTGPLTPLRTPCDGPAGLMLAINTDQVIYVQSFWSEQHRQNLLRVVMASGQSILVFEADAANMLAELGLVEYADDWTLNLEVDLA